MKYGEWLPLFLGAATEGLAILLALLVPETLHLRDLPDPPLNVSGPNDEFDAHAAHRPSSKGRGHGFKGQLHRLNEALRFMRLDISLSFVVFTFFCESSRKAIHGTSDSIRVHEIPLDDTKGSHPPIGPSRSESGSSASSHSSHRHDHAQKGYPYLRRELIY